jgi:hypothetical protein
MSLSKQEEDHPCKRYVSGDVYAHAKVLKVLLSLAQVKRLSAEISVNVVHPCIAWT